MLMNIPKIVVGLFCATTFVLCAQELITNGSFENGLTGWTISGENAFDTLEKVDGEKSLKVCKQKGRQFNEIYQFVKVEPATKYELSYYQKTTGLTAADPRTTIFGISSTVQADKIRRVYGKNGLWCFDHGSFDWTKITILIDTADYGNPKELRIGIQCPNSTGTFWIDAVSLKKVVKQPYHLSLFPLRFLGNTTYTIAENLVGTIFMNAEMEPGFRYQKGTKASMTLELPAFIRFAGAVDRFVLERKGMTSYGHYPFSEKMITRNGQAYRRYTIHFDELFAPMLHAEFYHKRFFLVPEKNSTGKRGMMYWTFNVGGDQQKEESFPIAICPAIHPSEKPCRRFCFDVGYSSVHVSPFKHLRPIMTKFWKTLAEKPILQLDGGEGSDPDFDIYCVINGNDAIVDTPFGRRAFFSGYNLKTPADLKADGSKEISSPGWYKLDDPAKLFEDFLRASIRDALKHHPEIRAFKWNYEPVRCGFDLEGRRRFAEDCHLAQVPSAAEIQKKYAAPWKNYQYKMNARVMAKVTKIIKSEAPNCKIIMTTTGMMQHNAGVSDVDDIDERMSDREPNIDMFEAMIYSIGTRFFDDVRLNTSTLKKPVKFAQDPSERIWSYFRMYTPARLYQNILAVAALGGKGICHWPDDSMIAEYYQTFSDAYGIISKYEDVYFDGRRVDGEFQITAQNVVSKTVTDGERKITLQFPDFKSALRMTAHEYKGKYYLTVFNYNENDEAIVLIKGCGKKFLAAIPACGAKIIEADAPGDQKILERKVAEYLLGSSSKAVSDLTDGANSIAWTLGSNGKPVLRLANCSFKVDIDALFSGELVGFRQKTGADLFSGGSGARLIFYDPEQPPFTFRQKEMTLDHGNPKLVFEADVPAYAGAGVKENPLLGLKITRTYILSQSGLKIAFRLFNPSKHAMKFGFRIFNYPQTGGRFGQKNLEAVAGSTKITTMSPEHHDFVRPGKQIPVRFPGVRVKHEWTGTTVVSSSADGFLRESLEFIPDPSFTGLYIWNSQYSKPGHTIELMTPEIRLAPNTGVEYSYLIK